MDTPPPPLLRRGTSINEMRNVLKKPMKKQIFAIFSFRDMVDFVLKILSEFAYATLCTKFRTRTEKSSRNLIASTWNLIVFTMHRLIWIQTDVCFDPNQLKNGKYNLISVWLNKIWKEFLCVQPVMPDNQLARGIPVIPVG